MGSMGGTETKGEFPLGVVLGVVIVIALIAGGYYYYTTYMQEPVETEDVYGPQLEALNNEIYQVSTKAASASARADVESIEGEITDDPAYSKYLPLVEAQKAVLDVIDIEYLYYDEADEYAESGVDCSKDYDELVSTFEGAEAKANNAKYKVNEYLYENENSTAEVLLTRVDAVDLGGMDVFLEILERDYSKSCIEPETPTGTYATPLSKEDAVSLVLAEVVGDNDYYVYMVDSIIESGAFISIPRPEGDYNLTLDRDIWLFYIDEQPLAPFAHPTHIVFVDVDDAEYIVYDEEYYPIIDGVSYWSTLEERENEENVIYPAEPEFDMEELNFSAGVEYKYTFDYLGAPGSGVPAGTPVPFDDDLCCEGVEKKKYGLVVQGYDEQMFKSDTVNAYNMLATRGYSNADITYLTANAGDALSDGQTTLESVGEALVNIANNAKCCDEVFIYLSGHGASVTHWQYKHKTTGETKWIRNLGQLTGGAANWEYTGNSGKYHRITLNPEFTTPAPEGEGTVSHGSSDGGRAWSWEFAAFLNKMDSCYITFMYFSCYSGVAAPTLAGKGRTIITPVGDRPAWGRSTAGFGSYFTNFFIEAKGKGGDAAVDKNGDGKVSDKEAFDYAKAKTSADATAKGRTQEGTWTPSTERCRCCHVICDEENDYICKAVEGEGTDSEKCPKVGDYCGPTITPEDHMECVGTVCMAVPGEGEDSCTTDEDCRVEEPPEDEVPVCGDGKITPPEECDYETYGKNTCPEGEYCKDDCLCHPLETSVVCGDGKISSPEEDCDGGNVKTDICPEGYGCYICKCEPIEAFCGDGMIHPPEECDHGNTITEKCDDGEVCQGCQCIPRSEATHKECVNEACVSVAGYGEDQCYSDSQCETPKHNECIDNACVEVDGEGTDQCQTDGDCEEPPECGDGTIEGWEECEEDDDCPGEDDVCIECFCLDVPAYCGDGNLDAGEECEDDEDCSSGGVCSGACTCVYPPELDCSYICSEAGYPENYGGGFDSVSECSSYVESLWLPPPDCTTGCAYAFLYKATNIAGESTCCCGDHDYYDCTNCPCVEPCDQGCPDTEVVCTAH